ncbi:CD9 antigen [Octopus bimaculoides]|uniref:Tetraspanin n=1 Tax=Octopus bimaculoides TaxID=37653 RepID=A0A0L8H0J0_OCTBM|nr:CD9 antigen [Octopus bimaculoides]XP_052825132.1 CD9 antigen [Octopus bimaculoides]|eukprot:XP_014776502.1 PREDICTED: CD9 antigen-like [Octopus bimaculoides]
MGVLAGLVRCLFILFNFIFWLSGVAILGVGVWMVVDPNIVNRFEITVETEDPYFRTSSYILIAFGVFVFLVGFCGCCGAIRKSKCLLGFYFFFLLCIMAGELAAGILAALYKKEILGENLASNLQKFVKTKYGTPTHQVTSTTWDIIQMEGKCCGALGARDYINSTWYESFNRTMKLPRSCCKMSNNNPLDPEYVEENECISMISEFNTKGCRDEMASWISKHLDILIGVGCGIAVLEMFGLIVSIFLCRETNRETASC